MKDRFSLRSLILIAAALFVLVLVSIFMIFNSSFHRTDHIIQLPLQKTDTAVGSGATIAGTPIGSYDILTPDDPSIALLMRSIPADSYYQLRGDYLSDGEVVRLSIFYNEGKCKIVVTDGNAPNKHVLILPDRFFTWSDGDKRAAMQLSNHPYQDSGFSFLDFRTMRGDAKVYSAENESSFGLSSLSFRFTVNDIRHVYTVSSETGCIFSYSARRNGKLIEQFLIETIILGRPADSIFDYPGKNE